MFQEQDLSWVNTLQFLSPGGNEHTICNQLLLKIVFRLCWIIELTTVSEAGFLTQCLLPLFLLTLCVSVQSAFEIRERQKEVSVSLGDSVALRSGGFSCSFWALDFTDWTPLPSPCELCLVNKLYKLFSRLLHLSPMHFGVPNQN